MAAAGREPCQLALAIEAADGAVERLGAVLGLLRPSCVVIEPVASRALAAPSAQPLVEIVQKAGIAVLIADDAALARSLRADGVHLGVSDQSAEVFRAARAILGAGAIIGGDAGRSRHDAMTLGELGADYVAFGIPAAVKERDKAFERQRELVAWWAEIFEPACLAADVASPASAGVLAAAGADFVSLRLTAGSSVAEAVAAVRQWSDAIAGVAIDAAGT